MTIKTNKVASSNIDRAGFDQESGTLEVHFKNGTRYQYSGVSKNVYEGIFKAESPGKFFRKWVIQSGYKFKKLKK